MFNLPEIIISEDVCIMISTEKKAKIKNFPPMKFRYWLNAKFVTERAGINTISTQIPVESIDVNCLLPVTKPSSSKNST